jgi:hypothetical protein
MVPPLVSLTWDAAASSRVHVMRPTLWPSRRSREGEWRCMALWRGVMEVAQERGGTITGSAAGREERQGCAGELQGSTAGKKCFFRSRERNADYR